MTSPDNDDEQTTETPQVDTTDEAAKWKALAQKHELRAKANAEKAIAFDQLEESKKSETERLTEQAEQARQEAQQARQDSARWKVAVDKGLPSDLIQFLTGADEESLAAQADTLLQRISSASEPALPRKPVESLRGGATPAEPPASSASDIADQIAKRQRSY